jgi:hypothetical protein
MTTSTPEKQDGLKALTEAIKKIEDIITSMGGVFAIQMDVSRTFINLVGQVCYIGTPALH